MGPGRPWLRAGLVVWLTAAGVVTAVGGAGATEAPSPTAPGASASATATPSPSATDVGADLVQPGRLIICSSFPRLRFAEYAADGEPFGVDIEIGLEIAARLGLDPEVRDMLFEMLIDAVSGRECDFSIAGQFITQGRLELIDMIPYRQGTPHIVVRAGNPLAIEEVVDLCGHSLAVVSGSVHVDIVLGVGDHTGSGIDDQCREADRPAVALREYPNQEEAEDALARGEVDAYAGNDFVTEDRPQDFALSAALAPTRNGIGIRKGASLLNAGVRAALDAMIGDGTYLAILERHGVAHVAVTSPP